MAHQADIGQDVFDRWATYYIYEHQGKKYACVWKELIRTMMTEEEAVADGEAKVKDFYAFDEKKTLKFLQRAMKDYNKKVKEYEYRCAQRKARESKLLFKMKALWKKLIGKEVKQKEDSVRYSKMDEIVLRSKLYEGELKVGGTFFGVATIVEKTSNSFCLRLYRVTKFGRTGLQWFTQEEFGKRFLAK